jgi:hypothetical protein
MGTMETMETTMGTIGITTVTMGITTVTMEKTTLTMVAMAGQEQIMEVTTMEVDGSAST